MKGWDAPTCGVEALDEFFNLPCLDILLCFVAHFDRLHAERLEGACLAAKRARRQGREQGGGPLSDVVTIPNYFIESTKMTRKRKRDSGPSETAPDATSTAQPAQVNESGSDAAPVEEIGAEANMDLGVADAQNNAHGTLSAVKKRSKAKKKTTQGRGPLAPKPKIVKLKPARPYPTVPTSSSATVPKSRRAEGRNKICVTRRTELGSYLRQCRNVLTKDGYVHVQT